MTQQRITRRELVNVVRAVDVLGHRIDGLAQRVARRTGTAPETRARADRNAGAVFSGALLGGEGVAAALLERVRELSRVVDDLNERADAYLRKANLGKGAVARSITSRKGRAGK